VSPVSPRPRAPRPDGWSTEAEHNPRHGGDRNDTPELTPPYPPIALLPPGIRHYKNRLPPGKTDHFWPDHGRGLRDRVLAARPGLIRFAARSSNILYLRPPRRRPQGAGRADVVAEVRRPQGGPEDQRPHQWARRRRRGGRRSARGRWTLKAFLTEYCDTRRTR